MTETIEPTVEETLPAASTDLEVTQTSFLTRETILGVEDMKAEPVEVPEWGGVVLVRGLDGTGRDAYQASLQVINPRTKQYERNMTNATAKLVSRCIVDPAGNTIFNNGDVAALGRKSGAALRRVEEVAERLSGFTEAAAKDAEGNSDKTPSGDSGSDSPETPDSP